MKIESIITSRLTNASHLQFMCDVDQLINISDYISIKNELGELYNSYISVISQEMDVYQQELGSALTNKIKESDLYRSRIYSGLNLIIEGNTYSTDEVRANSAKDIHRIMRQFNNPTKLSLNDATSTINSLITVFESNLTNDILVVGVHDWVDKLKQANDIFSDLMRTRNSELAARNKTSMKEARLLVDAIYRKIVLHINALALLNNNALYDSFIQKQNTQINYLKNATAIKRGKAKSKKV